MRGHLDAEDYEREIKVPLVEGAATDEMVTLERFGEPGDDESGSRVTTNRGAG